jgi:hypothetical protein
LKNRENSFYIEKIRILESFGWNSGLMASVSLLVVHIHSTIAFIGKNYKLTMINMVKIASKWALEVPQSRIFATLKAKKAFTMEYCCLPSRSQFLASCLV